MAEREVTAEQLDRLIERLGEVVTRLDAFIAEVKHDYVRDDVHTRDLALIDNKVHDAQKDIDATRATLARVTFVAITGLVLPIIVAIVAGVMLGALR